MINNLTPVWSSPTVGHPSGPQQQERHALFACWPSSRFFRDYGKSLMLGGGTGFSLVSISPSADSDGPIVDYILLGCIFTFTVGLCFFLLGDNRWENSTHAVGNEPEPLIDHLAV